ncbi:conserved hypothetical protein [Syntrophobacter sp. SbD1]|nr:conserved hypothetical protein [Syntrophobacter sp. SbD1]
MEKNVSEELDVLRSMLNNWKTGFLTWASPDGDNDHVLLEFTEEIQTHVYPYVKRLFETNYLSEVEAREFMNYCFGQVEDLRVQLSKAQPDESRKEA